MELKVIKKDKKAIEIEFLDRDENFLVLLHEELLKNKKVETVLYTLTHPVLGTPSLSMTMKSGKPETALKKAAQDLIKKFENVEVAFEKAVSA